MKKIISLFQRNYDGDRLVRDEVVPGAEWVLAGQGVATPKWDGSCVLVRDGKPFKRYDLKRGKKAPAGFEPAQDPDPKTGNQPGWVPVDESNPADKWFWAAWLETDNAEDGTYEACGPHFGGGDHGGVNPEGLRRDVLIRHGHGELPQPVPLTFSGLRDYLSRTDVEGIVWHHPDGQMVKVKAKDFGLKRDTRAADPA